MLKRILINSNYFRRFLTTADSRTTLDQVELSKFEDLSKDWWDIFGTCKCLHIMNSVRVPFITNGLLLQRQHDPQQQQQTNSATLLRGLKILDVGCGGGILTEALGRLGATITGLDPNKELIRIAREHLEKQQQRERCNFDVEFCVSSVDDFVNSGRQFDAIVASEVIEHVNNLDIFLEHCLQLLKPQGSLFITTVNKTIWARIFTIFVAENVLKIIPKGTHEYEKFVDIHQLERSLSDQNCKIICCHGFYYNPINNTCGFCKDTSISYAVHAVKLRKET